MPTAPFRTPAGHGAPPADALGHVIHRIIATTRRHWQLGVAPPPERAPETIRQHRVNEAAHKDAATSGPK